jgi:hypothetical protein
MERKNVDSLFVEKPYRSICKALSLNPGISDQQSSTNPISAASSPSRSKVFFLKRVRSRLEVEGNHAAIA